MKNVTTSLLMTALLCAAGLAVAQTPAAPATRAEVKSEVVRDTSKAGEKNLGEPPKPGTASDTTRAQTKAAVDRSDRELSTGEKAATTTPSKGYAKRKALREERRAMNKSKSDMKMKEGTTAMPTPEGATNK
jgi:hypothetical protein